MHEGPAVNPIFLETNSLIIKGYLNIALPKAAPCCSRPIIYIAEVNFKFRNPFAIENIPNKEMSRSVTKGKMTLMFLIPER